ncbi:MAG: 50S ribosomal protein L7/L12 [Spirulinaceae cyanobacterium RM2_2_10]|nr:50S ribosomal protein L7/L12 [Spirulinaceae cyanobacterium SM2_1_0]NJO20689.1 50S ribosomal protein L7/L12 [Spirulinaceae cyanobacterium RM2_2_10]
MASVKVLAIVEQLKTLTLAETTELITLIETTFGVNVAPLQLKLQPPANPLTADLTSKTFAVVLEAVPTNKQAAALQIVWHASGSSLKQAKTLVQSLPSTIQAAVTFEEARTLKHRLESFGAKVTLQAAG